MSQGDARQQGSGPGHGECPEQSPHLGVPRVEATFPTMREDEITTDASTKTSRKGAEGQTTTRFR